MRHGIAGNRLGRNSSWRKATIRDIAKATLKHQRICTTKAKAKEARKVVDRLITMGKKGSLAHKRRAFAILCDHKLVSELFDKIAVRFHKREGGYTRMIPLAFRRGDSAQMVYLELTEKGPAPVGKKRRTSSKGATAPATPENNPVVSDAEISSPGSEAETSKKGKGEKSEKKKGSSKSSSQKDKSGKNIVGGIRKIFRRKTSE